VSTRVETVHRFEASLRDRVSANLQQFSPQSHTAPELRAAAVALVLLDDEEGRACFVLTRRASNLPNHPGQWALPGGRTDAGETHTQAALRECSEEVGLALSEDRVLGRLDDYPTRSGFVITPVVVWGGRDCEMTPNEGEVAAIYRVPLAVLDRPEVPQLREIPESDRPVISVPIEGDNIHAPTAAILYQMREVAIHGRGTRVAHFEQPVWAWR
jgi:8-oxo-dGTP pyrophosphatase MutT (NUDIX family)